MFQATRNRRLFGNKCLTHRVAVTMKHQRQKNQYPDQKRVRGTTVEGRVWRVTGLLNETSSNFQSPCFSAFNSFSAQCTVSMTLKPTVGELIILLQGKRFLYNAFLLRGLKAILPHSHEFFLSSVSYSDASIGVS